MKKNHLIIVVIAIVVVFGILTAIKQSQSAKEQSAYIEGRISDLEYQVQDIDARIE